MKYYKINELMFDNYMYLLKHLQFLMDSNKILYDEAVYQSTKVLLNELEKMKNENN